MKKGIKSEEIGLFDLRTTRPDDTPKIAYEKFGPLFGKKKFKQFQKVWEKDMGFPLDGAVYSRMILEVTQIDGQPHYELSMNQEIFLPIAGRQSSIIERRAQEKEIQVEGFLESFNFILNDSRNYQ
jgi:hypothetical protein